MFKNAMSKIALVITLMFACCYIFMAIGTTLTEFMEAYVLVKVLIYVIFAASVAKVFMDVIEKLDKTPEETKGH